MRDEKEKTGTPGGDERLERALGEFRQSVCAWSEAAMPQAMAAHAPRRAASWQRTLAWALGVVLTAGGASGAIYERHHQQVLRELAQQRELQRQRVLAAERAKEMDDLLAKVDQDISQEVPDALEPLAQMMADDGGSK